jgi:hypothetical protein
MQRASARWLAFPAVSALVVIGAAVGAQAQSADRLDTPTAYAIPAVQPLDLGGSGAAGGVSFRVRSWQWPVEHRTAVEPASSRSALRASRLAQNPASGSRSVRALKRVVGGLVGGAGGFMVGGLVGSKLEPSCGCDDPGLRGFLIGAPIGAALGAIAGVMSVP